MTKPTNMGSQYYRVCGITIKPFKANLSDCFTYGPFSRFWDLYGLPDAQARLMCATCRNYGLNTCGILKKLQTYSYSIP